MVKCAKKKKILPNIAAFQKITIKLISVMEKKKLTYQVTHKNVL